MEVKKEKKNLVGTSQIQPINPHLLHHIQTMRIFFRKRVKTNLNKAIRDKVHQFHSFKNETKQPRLKKTKKKIPLSNSIMSGVPSNGVHLLLFWLCITLQTLSIHYKQFPLSKRKFTLFLKGSIKLSLTNQKASSSSGYFLLIKGFYYTLKSYLTNNNNNKPPLLGLFNGSRKMKPWYYNIWNKA